MKTNSKHQIEDTVVCDINLSCGSVHMFCTNGLCLVYKLKLLIVYESVMSRAYQMWGVVLSIAGTNMVVMKGQGPVLNVLRWKLLVY